MSVTRQRGLLPRTFERIVKLNRPLTAAGIVLVSLTWLVSALAGFSFPDLWWQLREGLDYLESGTVQDTIARSYAPQIPGPHLDYHLYEVVLAALFTLGGLPLLRVIFIGVALLPYAITLFLLIRLRRLDSFSVLCLIMALACLFARVQQRPELIAFSLMLLLGLHLYFLPAERPLRLILVPMVLMALWANLHASFILGMAMGIAWAGSQWLPFLGRMKLPDLPTWKATALTLGALLAGGCLSPSGPARWLEPFQLQSSIWSILNSSEMWPPTPNIALFYGFILALTLASALVYRRLRWFDLWLLALPLLFLLMFLSHHRYIAFTGISFLLAAFLPPRSDRPPGQSRLFPLVYATVAIPLVIGLMLILLPLYSRNDAFRSQFNGATFSHQALDYLHRHHPRARIFADIRANSFAAYFYPEMGYYLHTGFSRFQPEALKTFFMMNHDPVTFLDNLRAMEYPCVIVGGWNPHWALALDTCSAYRLAYLGNEGALYVPAGLSDLIPVRIDTSLNLLPQLSRADDARERAEILSRHLDQLTGDAQGVLFLEDWLSRQDARIINATLDAMPEHKANILRALSSGLTGDRINELPSLVQVRFLAGRNQTEQAGRVLARAMPFDLKRKQLESVMLRTNSVQ